MLAFEHDAPTTLHAPLSNLYCTTSRRYAREPEPLATTNELYALPLWLRLPKALRTHALLMRGPRRLGPRIKAHFTVVGICWVSERLLKEEVCQTWFEGKRNCDRDDQRLQ